KEADCIWCMACVEVCPTTAIKVDEANLDIHKKTSETAG
ncbi:MAG: 4Fe-4S binding protein, partial [Nitrososphaeraceae archaeon]